MSSGANDWLARLKSELGRDKKKAAALTALAALAIFFVARAVLKSSPRPAAAAPSMAAPAEPPSGAPAAPKRSPDRRARDEAREQYVAEMDRRITRDLFRPNPDYFPLESASAPARTEPPGAGWFAQGAEWVDQKRAQQEQQQAQQRLVEQQAQALSLESTILGTTPTALINGRVLKVGDTVNGFEIVSIQSDTCTLVKDGVRVERRMKK